MIVSAPCRLHFGLFHVPVDGLSREPNGEPVRKFGGLGLMIREPRVRVECRRAARSAPTGGTLRNRAEAFRDWICPAITVASSGGWLRYQADGPPEHVGLGVGTALGLAMATAANRSENGFLPESDLPRVIERGKRSGIGIEGFRSGGFIVDDGKIGDEPPAIRERIAFPDDWRIVLIRQSLPGHWHGERERAAFGRGRSPQAALDTTRRLRWLTDEAIVPALKRAEFESFARGITQFNRIAGEPFAADQGGPYASPAIAELVEQLLGWGVLGVGQSSWGPTVFAFAKDGDEAENLKQRLRRSRDDLAYVSDTPADNVGARIETTTIPPIA